MDPIHQRMSIHHGPGPAADEEANADVRKGSLEDRQNARPQQHVAEVSAVGDENAPGKRCAILAAAATHERAEEPVEVAQTPVRQPVPHEVLTPERRRDGWARHDGGYP